MPLVNRLIVRMRESGRAFFLLSSQLSRLDSLDDFLLVSFSRVFLLASTNCCILFSIFLKNETNNKKSCEINTLLSGTTAVGHFHRKVPGQSNCNIHIPYYFHTKSVKNPELKIFKKYLQILSSQIIILFSSLHIYFSFTDEFCW